MIYFSLYSFNILNETDLGNYTCVFGNEAKIEFILTGTDHIIS